jgi:hypothetical protein
MLEEIAYQHGSLLAVVMASADREVVFGPNEMPRAPASSAKQI